MRKPESDQQTRWQVLRLQRQLGRPVGIDGALGRDEIAMLKIRLEAAETLERLEAADRLKHGVL